MRTGQASVTDLEYGNRRRPLHPVRSGPSGVARPHRRAQQTRRGPARAHGAARVTDPHDEVEQVDSRAGMTLELLSMMVPVLTGLRFGQFAAPYSPTFPALPT
jgi:hypothetical protein